MQSPTGSSRRTLALRVAVAIAAPLLVLAALELGVRVAGLAPPDPADDPTRGFLGGAGLFEEIDGEGGAKALRVVESRTAMMQRLQFNPQTIPLDKPADETRIVCLGGSMTYGWPFDDRLSYPRMLEAGLRAAAPDRRWRVINLGAPGWGSTRIAMLAEEVARLDPDVVVVTTGNNEALEAAFAKDVLAPGRSTMRLVAVLNRRSHLFRWLRGAVQGEPEAPPPVSALDAVIPDLDDAARSRIVERYRANLESLSDSLLAEGIDVRLTGVPVNLRDCPPISPDAPGEPRGSDDPAVIGPYRQALSWLGAGRAAAALDPLRDVRQAAPGSARARFAEGRALEIVGRWSEAAGAYRDACDRDGAAMRAFSGLAAAARDVASRPGVSYVDLVAAMDAASEFPAPGDDLFLDNCHPRERGHAVLAYTIAGSLTELDAERGRAFEHAVAEYVRSIELDPQVELRALEFLRWYYTALDASPSRVAVIEARIDTLDR